MNIIEPLKKMTLVKLNNNKGELNLVGVAEFADLENMLNKINEIVVFLNGQTSQRNENGKRFMEKFRKKINSVRKSSSEANGNNTRERGEVLA